MSESPYQSPSPESFGPNTAPDEVREKTRKVAKYQRWVIFSILGNFAGYVIAMAVTNQPMPMPLVGIFALLAATIFGMASIFLLAKELNGAGIAILCVILMFLPCVSLITLLVLNQKATTHLQSNGIKVGFLGTNPNSI